MATTVRQPLAAHVDVEIVFTDAGDGDFSVDAAGVEQRRRSLIDTPWTWLRLQHGGTAVVVREPGDHAGQPADAGATVQIDAPIAVTTADCAGVVLCVSDGQHAGLAVAHVGWRGLVAGVIEAAAQSLDQLAGAPWPRRLSVCGPCIGPDHYAFGETDLGRVAERYGTGVRGHTAEGHPALDLFAGVRVALERCGFEPPDRPPNTADPRFFSHRVRSDPQRMVTVARLALRG